MIQYPPTYVNHSSMQRPIVLDNNLVRSASINSKGGYKDNDESKYSQPRWCTSGLTHTQKRRLQRMRKQGSMEKRAAVIPARSTITKQVWRPKQVVPWFESKFMADEAIIALRNKIWTMHCWSLSLVNFDLCECFLARKLYQKTGGICSHRCGQRPWKQFGLHHWIGLVE
jgi:hypothetical protein